MNNLDKYKKLAPNHTENELSKMIGVANRTIRRYSQQTGIPFKSTNYKNKSLSEWKLLFDSTFAGKLIVTDLQKTKNGKVEGKITCCNCNTSWRCRLSDKIKKKTLCISCSQGNCGNKYTHDTVLSMLNSTQANHWDLIEYNSYSKLNNKIKCLFCDNVQVVNLSNFINTTTKRCPFCESGSFGEFIIASTLRYNNISFEREFVVSSSTKSKLRIDFMTSRCAIEFNGEQHDNPGLYYNSKINNGMILKEQWCINNNISYEIISWTTDIDEIISKLSDKLKLKLKKPTPEYFSKSTPKMKQVLEYMKTNSARSTSKDLNIPTSKLKKFVKLAGYSSISDWQNSNYKK